MRERGSTIKDNKVSPRNPMASGRKSPNKAMSAEVELPRKTPHNIVLPHNLKEEEKKIDSSSKPQ